MVGGLKQRTCNCIFFSLLIVCIFWTTVIGTRPSPGPAFRARCSPELRPALSRACRDGRPGGQRPAYRRAGLGLAGRPGGGVCREPQNHHRRLRRSGTLGPPACARAWCFTALAPSPRRQLRKYALVRPEEISLMFSNVHELYAASIVTQAKLGAADHSADWWVRGGRVETEARPANPRRRAGWLRRWPCSRPSCLGCISSTASGRWPPRRPSSSARKSTPTSRRSSACNSAW